ncbi:uncharacterized protein [Temnothorax longispinosus]|uniref:uncharacterized protein isoform X2 n=1 Tax=Temnothorax longispinosus TaxID=300112 RepID=UPI003A99D2D8
MRAIWEGIKSMLGKISISRLRQTTDASRFPSDSNHDSVREIYLELPVQIYTGCEWKTSKLKERSDNNLIIQKKLDALNSVALTFESSKSVNKFVTKNPQEETSDLEIQIDENELLNKVDICYTKIKTLEAENEKLQNVIKEREQELKEKNFELHKLKEKLNYMEMCNNKQSPTCTIKSPRESATSRKLFSQTNKTHFASPSTTLQVSPILGSCRHSTLRKRKIKYDDVVDDEDCRVTDNEPPAKIVPKESNDVAVSTKVKRVMKEEKVKNRKKIH